MKKLIVLLLLLPLEVIATWQLVINNEQPDKLFQLAESQNNGYRLSVYRDQDHRVRLRFNLNGGLDQFAAQHCPSYEIDSILLSNRSINDARCLMQAAWCEFILGTIEDGTIRSNRLHALLNGENIHFRFMLSNGLYKETSFSLADSKKIILQALGANIRYLD